MRRVAVATGGPSAEAEVSRASAEGVVRALTAAGYAASAIEVGPRLASELEIAGFEVVFPVTHGGPGEDGSLQGLLEIMELPYVGSGVLASAVAMDKPSAKAMFERHGLPVLDDWVVGAAEAARAQAASALDRLGPSVVVKPSAGGSAIGVTILRETSEAELIAHVESALVSGAPVLVEPFVSGLEVTCGVLEWRGRAHALPPTEIVAKAADFYDFTSKYASGGSEHRCPAPLAEDVSRRVQELAVAAHLAIGARDLSRVDFIVVPARGIDGITLLEINTLPGMTKTSLFPEAAAVAGIGFSELCAGLVERAATRERAEPPVVLGMPGEA